MMVRHDNLVLFVFDAVIPDAAEAGEAQELARLMTTEEHAKRIAKMLCRSLNYYPDEEEAREDVEKSRTSSTD